jgi:hypothetical protein
MAYELWSQDIFSKGELSPFMYARATVNEYGNGLKTAQNVLTYPTGAAGKRFGTLFQAIIPGFTTFDQLYFDTFQYLNEAVYQLVFIPGFVRIYLEGILQSVKATPYNAVQTYNMSTTVLGTIFRIATLDIKPYDLTRSPDVTTLNITGITSTTLIAAAAALTVGQVLPIRFTNSANLPNPSPLIFDNVTYFIMPLTATTFSVYTTAKNAKFNIDPFTFSGVFVGPTTVTIFNTWAINPTVFKNLPFYDFNSPATPYNNITFTPGARTGIVTVTLSAPYVPLTAATYVGGAFFGGGGSGRITAVADNQHFTLAVSTPFDADPPTAIQGSLAYLAEPAWSDDRGWPIICSSYQNRGLFANTKLLPNGFWASVINDYVDFGDLTNDNDDAISWYPSSNNVNYIRFIVPYRSITVHTNTGIYSSPLSDIAAITPTNFSLQLQDSSPADVLLPQAIDNQVVVLTGNDAHQMLWDGINNAYTSDIVSVISEQLIRTPRDEVAFVDLKRAGSRYVFIINADGSMAIFQTLLSQNVSGFTPQIMEQSYGLASFIQAASSSDGRCWFIVQRDIATAFLTVAITGFTPYIAGPPIVESTLKAIATNFSLTEPTAFKFTTTGSLPTSSPQVQLDTYYWAIGTDSDDFIVYLNQDDARAGVNAIKFSNPGTNSNVEKWILLPSFILEELTEDVFLDCAVQYGPQQGGPTSTINTGILFNAQNVKMVGDGFGFEAIGNDNEVNFEAHGDPVNVTKAYIGYPINTIIEPMPLTIANGPSAKNTTLTKPKHIQFVRFMFNNTIGGTINGVPIALNPINQTMIGNPPFPARGIFEMSIMKGWDDFNNPTYTIEHNEPFNIQLLGVFYSVVT